VKPKSNNQNQWGKTPLKSLTLFIIILLLNGCAFGIIDHTSDTRHKELLATCFSTKKPSFLYEARCNDLQASGFGGRTFCTGIQVFGPLSYKTYFTPPNSWSEYLNSRKYWDEKLFRKYLFEKQRSLIAPIEVGTQMRIVGVYEYPKGTFGHVVTLTAELISGEYKGTKIQLSSEGSSESGQSWISQMFYRPTEELITPNDYLQKCM